MSEYELTVRPFAMGTEKEAALKPLEEAAEAFGAWQLAESANCHVFSELWSDQMADELADTIQAACNLAARYDIDLASAMERCEERNRERGRYE